MDHRTAAELIAFEQRIVAHFAAGRLPFLIHLSGGNEGQLIDIFGEVKEGDWIFSGHRSHYHYLLAGGSPERLEALILDGRSMFVFDKSINFLTSSVLAGTACIAAGVGLALKQAGSSARVWCFLGDGAEEQGHFYEAVSFVHWHDLPVNFIVEDNNRSVDTPKADRRPHKPQRWQPYDRCAAIHEAEWPSWPSCVRRYSYKSTFPHGGAGLPAGSVKFDPAVVASYAAIT